MHMCQHGKRLHGVSKKNIGRKMGMQSLKFITPDTANHGVKRLVSQRPSIRILVEIPHKELV